MPTASRSDVAARLPKGVASAEVQTTLDGLYYFWDTMGSGMTYPGIPYGLHFVDPTPIASHVVSADALEGKQCSDKVLVVLSIKVLGWHSFYTEYLAGWMTQPLL